MYDRSPVGLNHWLGHKMRAMLARHVFKHCGNNVKIFHGVEFSFGYNLTVEDNCTIHKYVLLDDRGEIIIHEGSLGFRLRQYLLARARSQRRHDRQQSQDGDRPKARVTYHATVLSGVKVGEHGMVGSMGVASKDVDALHRGGRHSRQANQGKDRSRRKSCEKILVDKALASTILTRHVMPSSCTS